MWLKLLYVIERDPRCKSEYVCCTEFLRGKTGVRDRRDIIKYIRYL